MRIFKLARRSVGLQSIAYTVKTSYKVGFKLNMLHLRGGHLAVSLVSIQLGVFPSSKRHFTNTWQDLGRLFSLVFMGMLVFGSLAFYIENGEEDTGFYSIPQVLRQLSI